MKTILSKAIRCGQLLVLLAVMLMPSVSRAQTTSQYMSFQGYLTDGNGNVLGGTNTGPKAYDVVFRIWDAATLGNEWFAELQTVTVDNGYFSVLLGSGTTYAGTSTDASLHVPLINVFSNSSALSRYVEMTVLGLGTSTNGLTILPRLQLVASPFAFQAANALNVTGTNIIGAANFSTNVGVWLASGTNTSRTNGNVGIGTAATATAVLSIGNPGITQLDLLKPSSTIGYQISTESGGLDICEQNTACDRLYIQNTTGYVGIGTGSPTATLDVNGNMTVNGSVTASSFSGAISGVPTLSGANTYANTSSQTYGSDLTGAGSFNYYGTMNLYSQFGPFVGCALVLNDSTSRTSNNGGLYYNYTASEFSSDASAYDITFRNADGKILIQSGTGSSDICVATSGNVGVHNSSPSAVFQVENAQCNGTTWANASDRNLKNGFAPVSPAEMLAKVVSMPVQSWFYKAQPGEKHIGPVAQDFHAAFGLNGGDDKHITTVDEGGVALAAIQGLNEKLQEKDAELEALKAQVQELQAAVKSLNKGQNNSGQ